VSHQPHATPEPSDAKLEIHGYVSCPFAWRVRLAAAEKGIAADWIPSDVDAPDERSGAHNPEEHSPLLYENGFVVVESDVIMQYLDEARPGRGLMPQAPRARAKLRERAAQLRKLDVHNERLKPEARRRSAPALQILDAALAERPYLHGDEPGHVDLLVWPFVADLAVRHLLDPQAHARVAAYVKRAAARASFQSTLPPWAASLI
jgi:glutathione S-transferase